MAVKKKAQSKNPRKKSSKRGLKLAPSAVKRGLAATEVALPIDHAEITAVVELVQKAGGAPLGAYREPLGGRPLLLASLPFSAVQPTPFQRDLSPTHAKRLAGYEEKHFRQNPEPLPPATLWVAKHEGAGVWLPAQLRFESAYGPIYARLTRVKLSNGTAP